MTRGVADAIATIIRGENGWLVHQPEDGPLYEFRAIPEVANFLAFGDAKCCRGSWMRAPWRAPAETPKWLPGGPAGRRRGNETARHSTPNEVRSRASDFPVPGAPRVSLKNRTPSHFTVWLSRSLFPMTARMLRGAEALKR
jgi:hypothetical protein